jgi:excinuclease ABC subunit C
MNAALGAPKRICCTEVAMSILLKHRPEEFSGFGPSILVSQSRGRLARHVLPDDRQEARALLHDQCPLTPGVYGWLDSNQQICYVGKSKSLRSRLLTYFAKNPTDEKAEKIRRNSTQLVWEPISEELLALIREQELIHRWRPDFNTQGQPTRRQPAFVCVSKGIAPQVQFARQLPAKAACTFGPIAGTSELRAAVDSLNTVFRLRDCPDKTKFEYQDQLQLFIDPATAKCIRFELGTCSGPCAAKCSHTEYRQQVEKAIAFLEGRDRDTIAKLELEMQTAAAECRFERAATLRDHLAHLTWLERRLSDIRSAQRRLNGILPLAGRNRQRIWLVLRGAKLIGSAPEPNRSDRATKAIEFLSQLSDSELLLPTNILEMHLQLLIISWFRKHPHFKRQLIGFEEAVDVCKKVA